MTDERSPLDGSDAVPAPDAVIPPGAYDPAASGAPSQHGVPLAPSLSGAPAAPVYPQTPAYPQSPPYANSPYPASAPHPQAPGYPASASYPASAPYTVPPGYPAFAATPPPASNGSNKTLWIVLGTVGGFVLLSIVGAVMLFSMILRATPDPVALPTGIPSSPSDSGTDPGDDEEDNPFLTQRDDGIDAAAGEDLAQLLDDTKSKYLQLRDSGELWQQIPDTEFNRTALSAFLFFVADMKVATIWGITTEQADEYEQRLAMLEERLLAQQPLGEDIRLTTDEGVFTYDGETGEGGWAEG